MQPEPISNFDLHTEIPWNWKFQCQATKATITKECPGQSNEKISRQSCANSHQLKSVVKNTRAQNENMFKILKDLTDWHLLAKGRHLWSTWQKIHLTTTKSGGFWASLANVSSLVQCAAAKLNLSKHPYCAKVGPNHTLRGSIFLICTLWADCF